MGHVGERMQIPYVAKESDFQHHLLSYLPCSFKKDANNTTQRWHYLFIIFKKQQIMTLTYSEKVQTYSQLLVLIMSTLL